MTTPRPASKLLISESPLQVLPSLAVAIGLNEALFLQQLNYWLNSPHAHERDGAYWIYNSVAQWHKQLPFWSEHTIRRTIYQLEHRGLIRSTESYNKMPQDHTKWYTIDYAVLAQIELTAWEGPSEFASPSVQSGQAAWPTWTASMANLDKAIPETTTETNNRESVAAAVAAPAPTAWQDEIGPPCSPDTGVLVAPNGRVLSCAEQPPVVQVTVVPAGTPVNRQPGAPAPLVKRTQDPEVTAQFAAFWAAFPGRPRPDGPKKGRKSALEVFAYTLTEPERAQAVIGAGHYRAGRDARDGFAKDPVTWLQEGDYAEYQQPEPAEPTRAPNGHPAPPPTKPRYRLVTAEDFPHA